MLKKMGGTIQPSTPPDRKHPLRRSCDTGMRGAQSGDCVLPSVGARRYKANYRGIEGEHWAQCARVRRSREEHTLVKRIQGQAGSQKNRRYEFVVGEC